MTHILGNIHSTQGMALFVSVGPSNIHIDEAQARHTKIAKPFEVSALIDTGSSISVLSPQVIRDLKLRKTGNLPITEVGRTTVVRCDTFLVNFMFRSLDGDEFIAPNIQVQEKNLDGQPFQCLIGLNLLKFGVLTFIGPQQHFSLSF